MSRFMPGGAPVLAGIISFDPQLEICTVSVYDTAGMRKGAQDSGRQSYNRSCLSWRHSGAADRGSAIVHSSNALIALIASGTPRTAEQESGNFSPTLSLLISPHVGTSHARRSSTTSATTAFA